MPPSEQTARLLIQCADRPGIVASVSNFLYNHGANITALDQHSTDPEGGVFFMRLEFQTPQLDLSRPVLERTFADAVAKRFEMDWRISYASDQKRMAVLVSRHDHAMLELLWRTQRGELPATITQVISNHPDLEDAVSRFGIPYHHISMNAKHAGEERMLDIIGAEVDVIVLARYMQILSESFVDHYPNQIINIHHSFLPAFIGADPYRQAYERGVKLIGATAHYVTHELDMGPIIEQDIVRVSHRQGIEELKQIGRDVERSVLARAVQLHLEDRLLVHENKTVVFV